MSGWAIFGIITAIALVLGLLLWRQRKANLAKLAQAKKSAPGAGLLNLAEQIPTYGVIATAAKGIGKPVHKVADAVLNTTSSALRHIPVAGGVLSGTVNLGTKVVDGTLNFLGL